MNNGDMNEAVQTDSRFRVWWLTAFNGYRVNMSRRSPRAGMFGRIRYDIQWTLTACTPEK